MRLVPPKPSAWSNPAIRQANLRPPFPKVARCQVELRHQEHVMRAV